MNYDVDEFSLEHPLVLKPGTAFYEQLWEKALSDIRTLERKKHGPVKAGVRWDYDKEKKRMVEGGFNRPFGRDQWIFLLQICHDAEYAANASAIIIELYGMQGKKTIIASEEEPGKFLHEHSDHPAVIARFEERGWRLPYYGSVDSTPLGIIALAKYYEETGDINAVRPYWRQAKKALHWIDKHGDKDGDGFVEYQRLNPNGLENQVWKDSWNSLHRPEVECLCDDPDVRAERSCPGLVIAPAVPAEVQGWVYVAKRKCAMLARLFNEPQLAKKLEREASLLKARFNERFCIDGFIAQALDSGKKPVMSISSNAGQVLASGIVEPEFVPAVIERMLKPDMTTAWGLRTLASSMPSFDPHGYHNGTVWPFDVWFAIQGARRYGFHKAADIWKAGLLRAFARFEHFPELYVVAQEEVANEPDDRTLEERIKLDVMPISYSPNTIILEELRRYSRACTKQAWSAGAAVHLLTRDGEGKSTVLEDHRDFT